MAVALAAPMLACEAPPAQQPGGESPAATVAPPKLAVLIVVDQMRADYVDRFRGDWNGGLKRLLTEGAWFSNVAYPYLSTVTCPGHATISTGAFPPDHGIFQNIWYDRDSRRTIACTDDSNTKAVGYGVSGEDGGSSHRLLLPTFADQMRAQRDAHVATLSLKARSAIMLAGRSADAVTWVSPALDGWQTSSAFASQPVPAVKSFVDANPIDADFGRAWTRLLPTDRYENPDDGDGEDPPDGWTRHFPHVLKSDSGDRGPNDDFHDQWQHSPFADAYLGRFAGALVESLRLGKHEGSDVLGVGFSSPDLVGHAFGPDSQEVQDLYAHLDRTLDALFDRLDTLVGRNQYVVVFSSDHGVAPAPEARRKAKEDAGHLIPTKLKAMVERVARSVGGPGHYVAQVTGNDVYFQRGMYDKLRARPGALAAVIQQLEKQPGIARVFHAEQLRDGAASPDELLRAAALSHIPRTGGDLVLVPKSGWTHGPRGTSHGTANPYDQQVPLIVMGPGIKPGEYREAATPADIAPTLAALFDISLSHAEGRVLRSALAAAPPPSSPAPTRTSR